jgi:hypothetical protein
MPERSRSGRDGKSRASPGRGVTSRPRTVCGLVRAHRRPQRARPYSACANVIAEQRFATQKAR